MAAYGAVLLLAAIAYFLLKRAIIASHGPGSTLKGAIGGDFKGKVSIVVYVVAIPLAFTGSWIACGLYVPSPCGGSFPIAGSKPRSRADGPGRTGRAGAEFALELGPLVSYSVGEPAPG